MLSFAKLSYIEKCWQILLYFTVALILALIAVGVITRKLNRQKLTDFYKYAIGILVGFSLCASVIMVTLTLDDMISNGEIIPKLFYPLLSCVIVAILLFVGGLVVSMLKPQKIKAYALISLGIFAVPLIVSLVMISLYYKNEIVPSNWYSNVSNLGLWLGAVALVVAIVSLTLIFGKKNKSNTKSIVYAAVCVALSFALSYIRLFRLPQGGSVTLVSVLPLMIYSYMFGIRKGVATGLIYGILQAVQDPWIIHPAQFLLDYPVAFASIGLSGILKEVNLFSKKPVLNFIIGGIMGGLLRYICHVISGIFAFSSYAKAGYGAVAWGFLYNTFSLVDLALALVAGSIMLGTKYFSNFVDKIAE